MHQKHLHHSKSMKPTNKTIKLKVFYVQHEFKCCKFNFKFLLVKGHHEDSSNAEEEFWAPLPC